MLVESFSGIRGIYNKDINEQIIKNYTLSYINFLKKTKQYPKIILGMDTRPSSPIIKEEMNHISLLSKKLLSL